MKPVSLLIAAAAAAACAACSSGPAPAEPLPEGALSAGTAQVSIAGRDAGTVHQVRCLPMGTLTSISTGTDTSGLNATISRGDELTAQSVDIRDLAGFTGSYNAGVGGPAAQVSMTAQTYVITGTATGFRTDAASFRAEEPFTIRVAC